MCSPSRIQLGRQRRIDEDALSMHSPPQNDRQRALRIQQHDLVVEAARASRRIAAARCGGRAQNRENRVRVTKKLLLSGPLRTSRYGSTQSNTPLAVHPAAVSAGGIFRAASSRFCSAFVPSFSARNVSQSALTDSTYLHARLAPSAATKSLTPSPFFAAIASNHKKKRDKEICRERSARGDQHHSSARRGSTRRLQHQYMLARVRTVELEGKSPF